MTRLVELVLCPVKLVGPSLGTEKKVEVIGYICTGYNVSLLVIRIWQGRVRPNLRDQRNKVVD